MKNIKNITNIKFEYFYIYDNKNIFYFFVLDNLKVMHTPLQRNRTLYQPSGIEEDLYVYPMSA